MEYYVNLNTGYDNPSATHNGTQSHAFCLSECKVLIGANTVNGISLADGDTLRLKGTGVTYNLFEDVEMTLRITSWPGREPWILDDSETSSGSSFTLANIGDSLIVEDGIIGGLNAKANFLDNEITFRNVLMWFAVLWSPDVSNSSIYNFVKCTLAGNFLLYGDNTASGEAYFIDCVFVDMTFTDTLCWDTIEFTGVNIFNQSQSAVNLLTNTVTQAGWELCTFSITLNVDFPIADGIELDDIRYTSFGLPIIITQPLRWITDSGVATGWADKFRYGYGAFYFNFDASATASPTHGTGPLTVRFTADATEEVVDENGGYFWDFGDGETSTEKNPEHVYIPGVYQAYVNTIPLWGEPYFEYINIYVYENDYVSGGRNVTKSSKIFRLAVRQWSRQGVGWSEYEGGDYPKALGFSGTCKIYNEEDEERIIVTDCDSFKHYWLGKENHWQDGGNDSYAGSEIESDILLREIIASKATDKVKHAESRADVKAWSKDLQNSSGYDVNGFRNGFTSSMYFKEDSSREKRAEIKFFPRRAQIVSDRHIESASVQSGIIFHAAPWKLINIQQWYKEINTAAAPPEKQMKEKTWAEELQNTVVWLGRSIDLISMLDGSTILPWDYGSNQRTTGAFTGVLEGPDGNSRSAISLGSSDYIAVNTGLPANDLSIVIWIKSPVSVCSFFTVGEITLRFNQVSLNEWLLSWVENSEEWKVPIIKNLSLWTALTITRNRNIYNIYIDGNIINSRSVFSKNSIEGPINFHGAVQIFEPRVVNHALSAGAIGWLYRDVVENGGKSTCAMY